MKMMIKIKQSKVRKNTTIEELLNIMMMIGPLHHRIQEVTGNPSIKLHPISQIGLHQLPSSNLLFMDLNDVDCDWSLIKNAYFNFYSFINCILNKADPSTVIKMGDGLLNLYAQSMPRLPKTVPKILQSDNSTEFINTVTKVLKTLSGLEHQFISAYHPQANRAAESHVKLVRNTLNKLVNSDWSHWHTFLPAAQYVLAKSLTLISRLLMLDPSWTLSSSFFYIPPSFLSPLSLFSELIQIPACITHIMEASATLDTLREQLRKAQQEYLRML
ncbi:Integrase catalytic domain-containing protein [Balamuthia mandrillaris]